MKVVCVLFDSLNRLALGAYGGDAVPTPNFDRLAERTTRFDNHYVGSMPCMPARRDMMTGRLNFLHRSWGPMEPFDIAFPERLAQETGTYSHLITDHFHYWEDGGATYHSRYDSHEFFRGQEGDRWQAEVAPDWQSLLPGYHPKQQSSDRRNYKAQYILNRKELDGSGQHPLRHCMDAGLTFLDRNGRADNWYLQIECFDPHEPFHVPPPDRGAGTRAPIFDWPPYGRVDELPEEAAQLRDSYFASVRHCDAQLGRILDHFDAQGLWEDTALIVTTDHGFLLGEHDFWAKNRMTLYDEIAHIPLFFHDPANPAPGSHVTALSQNIDLAATAYDLFGCAPPDTCQGLSLRALQSGAASREAVLFGYYGGAVNVADGRHTYHRYPPDLETQEIYQYTLMPTHIHSFFSIEELSGATLHDGFGFTQGARLLRVPYLLSSPMNAAYGPGVLLESQTCLFDLAADPKQAAPLDDPDTEARMCRHMAQLMAANDAPAEAFDRIELAP